MNADNLGVALAAAIAAILFVIFLIARRRERGHNPFYASEVFLYFNPADPTPDAASIASKLGATVATRGQVEVFARDGGTANGYGLVAGGAVAGLVFAGPGGGLAVGAFPAQVPPSTYGVWLYGPKPRHGTPGVRPFSCQYWFQPPASRPQPL